VERRTYASPGSISGCSCFSFTSRYTEINSPTEKCGEEEDEEKEDEEEEEEKQEEDDDDEEEEEDDEDEEEEERDDGTRLS
jgi:hypothetical protein